MYLEDRIAEHDSVLKQINEKVEIIHDLLLRLPESSHSETKFWSQKEAMAYLDVKSHQKMKKLREEDHMPFHRLDGHFRYKKSEIDQWLNTLNG